VSAPAVNSHVSWGIGRTIGTSLVLAALVPGCADPEESAGTDVDAGSCAPGQRFCDGRCVVTASDPTHCGACGVACQTGQACVAGTCVAGAGGAGGNASGGTPGTGGTATGGAVTGGAATGGAATGGAATGGTATGGAPASGGVATGGTAAGGAPATGGVAPGGTATGGVATSGASTGGASTGGLAPGGTPESGGAPTGGVVTGGVAGAGGAETGGAQTGGEAMGGNVPTGGATACSRAVGSCTAPDVIVTEVDVGSSVTSYGGEGDTEPLPMAIAAMPSGGSRLAWLGTDERVHVAELDCEDHLVGTPVSFPAVDLQDVYADEGGGVVLLTRDATNGGTDNCGGGQLCGGTSSQCRGIWMVRFDGSGNVVWETQVTNLSDSRAGYDDGAIFTWWYQHHGRLASDGSNYAAYFGAAISVGSSCVDIHEGDRMQVVGPTGTLMTSHPDAFDWGLSHAWTSRIVWDPRSSHFAMAAATDNECRIARPNYTTIAAGACDGTLFNGDLVLSRTGGYWDAWSQGGTIRLEHFGASGTSDQTIPSAGSSQHPHLVSYGTNCMLLAWASGSSMAAQVRDSGDGSTVGSQFTIGVSDHQYQAFKAYADGSVAYPAAGSGATSIKVARVMPCN